VPDAFCDGSSALPRDVHKPGIAGDLIQRRQGTLRLG
jgi:hypothetical protein